MIAIQFPYFLWYIVFTRGKKPVIFAMVSFGRTHYFTNQNLMKRPFSITLISIVYIVAGISGIIYHAAELKNLIADPGVSWVFTVRLAAVVGGWFALRGMNWARWLLVAWIAYHVFLSFHHTMTEIAIHLLITVLTFLALFTTKANNYFKGVH
jgi:hypothetical protein